MNNNTNTSALSHSEDSAIDIPKLLKTYRINLHWILLSILFCSAVGYAYVKYAVPIYKVNARILVNDEKKGGGISASGDIMGDLGGLLGTKSTVDNEVEILKTNKILRKVVEDLQLFITYYDENDYRTLETYDSPVRLNIIQMNKKVIPTEIKIDLLNLKQCRIIADDLDSVVNYNEVFKMPGVGRISIVRNAKVLAEGNEYSAFIRDLSSAVADLKENLSVGIANKQISIIDLTLDNSIPTKGEDILNRLIFNYVQENLRDKNEIADSTIAFIQRRLLIIGGELGEAEGDIEGFKEQNNLADMSTQGRLLVETSGQYVSELGKVATQISIINSVLEYLDDEEKNKRVLPSTLMPTDVIYGGAIEKYNALLLERGRNLIGLSESNPIILNLDKQIENSRNDIKANLLSTLKGLRITERDLNLRIATSERQIKKVPTTEKNYLKLARQQQIKQELYLFLMQKSEETAISKTANIANSKVIDPPTTDVLPFFPNKKNILLISLFIGLVLPIAIIHLKELLNNKVETKDDIAKITSVPVIGEISHADQENSLAVSRDPRSIISEQFRALRTNLSFYLKDESEKVILLTSSASGEGKSFLAINLGHILALSGKRILLLEFDLRKPGLSSKLGLDKGNGYTNYILSKNDEYKKYIKPLSINDNLFLMSSGPIPPNPSELLLSVSTKLLFEELRKDFDYVIVDAPPIGLVTDAQLLYPLVDLCLYLVRQNYTFKDQINIIEDLNNTDKMNNLAIIVNDIKAKSNYGAGYGYGNGYVYGQYDSPK